jgi:hypothetical protein
MEIAFYLSVGLLVILSLVSFVYFILVVMQMFKHDQKGLGITCLATYFLCGGIGALIAFVMGWVKASELGIKSLMWQWTGVTVVSMLLGCCAGGLSTSVMGQRANSTFMTVGSSISFTPRP